MDEQLIEDLTNYIEELSLRRGGPGGLPQAAALCAHDRVRRRAAALPRALCLRAADRERLSFARKRRAGRLFGALIWLFSSW